jgi:ABC-type enterochelin transport system permease subunit
VLRHNKSRCRIFSPRLLGFKSLYELFKTTLILYSPFIRIPAHSHTAVMLVTKLLLANQYILQMTIDSGVDLQP